MVLFLSYYIVYKLSYSLIHCVKFSRVRSSTKLYFVAIHSHLRCNTQLWVPRFPHNGWSNIIIILRQRWELLEVLDGIGQLHLRGYWNPRPSNFKPFLFEKNVKSAAWGDLDGLPYNYNFKALPIYCDGLFRWSITLIFLSIQNKENASSILSWAESGILT